MIIRRITKPSTSLSVFLLILTLFLPFSTILFSGTPVLAKTSYVKPSSEVVVRKGQGIKYKIVAVVKDGVSVEFLEEGDSYAKVRLANGKEGWMLKRFLSDEPPLEQVVASLRTEKEKMKRKEIEVAQKIKEVSSTLARTETEFDAILAERDQIRTDYQNLQQDTANVVQTKNDLLKTVKENELLVQKLASVQQENNSLKKDNAIKWFLSGGGVLLVGMFIGMRSSKSRRRTTSLL
ncbi:MAG: TIGR04211 family SH3 domain-containing protein [Thermodesulfobacteriota bacterium]|nr:TIGR04211 family SH3 domain-containing protein [Thermodesulfobacteriota bacterium]